MQKLRQKGYLCVIVQMPFNLAFLDENAADRVIGAYPQIKHWYLCGHSLGGAMASDYFSKHLSKADGIILLGSYVYGDIPLKKSLVLYGSNDKVLNRSKLSGKANEFEIVGGNHAQFGNYGIQKGDGTAAITCESQQTVAAQKIEKFIESSK
jgi:pimeloyl-ACP methyl ester carboxylesterase